MVAQLRFVHSGRLPLETIVGSGVINLVSPTHTNLIAAGSGLLGSLLTLI